MFFSALRGILLTVPTLLLLFSMLGALGCRYVAPSEFMPISYLGLGFPLIFIVYIIWLVAMVLFGCWKQLLILLPTLVCFPIMWDTFPFNVSTPKVDPNAKTLKIFTYNVYAFCYKGVITTSDIARLVEKEDPDIICMQEYIDFRAKEDKEFSKLLVKYPYSTVGDMTIDSHNRVVTLSRLKIVGSGVASKGKGNNKAIYSDVVVGNDTVRMINAHLASNHITFAEKQEIDSISHGFLLGKIRNMVFSLNKKVAENYVVREQMANDIDSLISVTNHRVLVCGDFNDVPVSYVYHKVKGKRMSVANEEMGWGYNYTFRESPFYFCIDHILYDKKKIDCLSYDILDATYSDHYPSVAQFSIKQ